MVETPPGERTPPAPARLPTLRDLVRPLGDRRVAAVALLFALALTPRAIVKPEEHDSQLAVPRPTPRPEFACLRRVLPADAVVAFFNEPDGTVRPESPWPLYTCQFELAPRLLVVRPPETWRTGDVRWFVGTLPGPEAARRLAARHELQVEGRCGPWAILRRAP